MNSKLKAIGKRWLMIWRCMRWGIASADPTSYFAAGSTISRDIVAGPYSFINIGCVIGPKVEIGAYTMLGPRVMIIGDDHVFDKPNMPIIFSGRPSIVRKSIIGRDVWIGAGAVIFAGVHIHDCAIVAAHAVVTKDVESFTVVAGVPARVIKNRLPDAAQRYEHLQMLNELRVCDGGHYIAPQPFFYEN